MTDKYLDKQWTETPKEIDKNFEGSIAQKLGYDKELCPSCNANLFNGICLNTCHLTKPNREKFIKGFGTFPPVFTFDDTEKAVEFIASALEVGKANDKNLSEPLSAIEVNVLGHLGYKGFHKAGNFFDSLIGVMLHADPINLKKLRSVFPEYVDAIASFQTGNLLERAGVIKVDESSECND